MAADIVNALPGRRTVRTQLLSWGALKSHSRSVPSQPADASKPTSCRCSTHLTPASACVPTRDCCCVFRSTRTIEPSRQPATAVSSWWKQQSSRGLAWDVDALSASERPLYTRRVWSHEEASRLSLLDANLSLEMPSCGGSRTVSPSTPDIRCTRSGELPARAWRGYWAAVKAMP